MDRTNTRSEERRVGKECRSRWTQYQAEDGIRDWSVTGVQTCALPIYTNTVNLMNSLLWPCHKTLAVWRCPADKSTSKHGGKFYPRVRSVSMNCWLNSDAPWNGQNQYKIGRASCRERV